MYEQLQAKQVAFVDRLPVAPSINYKFVVSCRSCHTSTTVEGIAKVKQFIHEHNDHYTWIVRTDRIGVSIVAPERPVIATYCPECFNRGWVVNTRLGSRLRAIPCGCSHGLANDNAALAAVNAIRSEVWV